MKPSKRHRLIDPVYLVIGGFVIAIAVWVGLCYHVFGPTSSLGWVCCAIGVVGFRILFGLFGAAASQPPSDDAVWQAGDRSLRGADPSIAALVGSTGRAVTALRPSGYIVLNGERYDAIAAGEFIEKDSPIHITGIRQGYLVVDNIPSGDG